MPDPTAVYLRKALQAAEFALVEAAEQIRSREGQSPAYRRAIIASDEAREALFSHHTADA
jgi:hypothetical protein